MGRGQPLCLPIAPAAHAQITCDDAGRLNASVLGDFESLVGEEVDDGLFETSLHMAGAQTCAIDLFAEPVHSCLWRFVSEQDAVATYNANVSVLASCIAGWERQSAGQGATSTSGTRMIAETRFIGQGAYVDVEWQLVVEQGADSGYRLWVELISF